MNLNKIHKFVRYDTDRVLLVSETQNVMTTLSTQEYMQCVHLDVTVCPSRLMTTNSSNCEVQLVLALNGTRSCKRVFSQSKHYVFLNLENHRVFTVNKTLFVMAHCFEQGVRTSLLPLELRGTGMIVNGKRCEIIGPDFVLPASLTGSTTVNTSTPVVYWPDVKMQPLSPANLTLVSSIMTEDSVNSLNELLHVQQTIL